MTDLTVYDESKELVAGMIDDLGETGFEDTGSEDFAIPFLRVVNALSKVLDEDEPSYNPDAKQGMIYSTTGGDLFDGKEGVLAVPVAYKHTYVEKAGDKFVAEYAADEGKQHEIKSTTDADGKYLPMLPNGNRLDDTRTMFVLVNIHGSWEPHVLSGTSTMIKWFKAWMSTARTKKYNSKAGPKVLPLFCQVYLLTTTKEKNDKGSWYVFSGPKFQGAVDSGLLADVKAFRDTVLADKAKVTRGGDAPVGDSDVPF